MTDEEEPVTLEVTDGLATITLNRPAKYNAMSMGFARAFNSSVRSIAERSDVGAILLEANGPAFCAGGDVVAMAAATDRQAYLAELAVEMHGGLGVLATLPVVVVVAVHGVVAGGGLGLVLAGDLVIAAEDSTFTAAYAGLGFTPDCGVTANLPSAIGVRRALQFSVGGHKLSAAQALDWGLVGEVVGGEQLAERAHAVARRVIDTAPLALGESRQLIRTSADLDLQHNLDREASTIVARSSSSEATDLFDRFLASRGPRA